MNNNRLTKAFRGAGSWLIVVSILLLISFTPVLAQSEDGGSGGFSDDFESGSLEGWDRSQDVIITEGVLKISPDNMAFVPGGWAISTIQVQVRFVSTPAHFILHYHASETGAYALHVTTNEVWLDKIESDVPTGLGSAPLPDMQAGNWLDIKLVVTDGQQTVTINDMTVITAEDSEMLTPGGVGFVVLEGPVEFDNLNLSGERQGMPAPGEGQGGEPAPGGEPVPGGDEPGMEPGMGEGQPEPPLMEGQEPVQQAGATPASPQASTTTGSSFLDELLSSQANTLTIQTFVINMVLSVFLSLILCLVYIHWGASLSNRRKFAVSLIMMTMTTTFIILVVRSSVALSLGLVGALSIVRFRTAVKEPEELAYLFLAIGLGIGLGDNQRIITIIAFAAAVIVIGLMRVFRKSEADVNLHLTVASHPPHKIGLEAVMSALKPHCSKIKLLRYDEDDHSLEIAFLIEFRKVSNLNDARAGLKALSEGMEITFLDNKGIW